MNATESVFYWATALFHAATFFTVLLALVFRKGRAFDFGRIFFLLAFVTLTVFGVLRWIRTGHPPFVTLFESMITAIWFVVLIFHLVRHRLPHFAILLLPVSAVSFLLLGWSSALPHEASPLSAALTNTWLFIHASFATSGAAAFLIAASFGVVYLLGETRLVSVQRTIAAVPEYTALPKAMLNFVIFGLILWGVMIVSGSIWAHVAWGRYWAWDPIELWSLISWLIYALLLHARLTFKMPQRVFAWLVIIAAATVAFSLWGVQYLYDTIHTYG
ncbi:MAG TPA: cytochrome c biogenesis protein CcsA [candidate division Zixibacteria bacterium]|nr:cytochrome c biogenesis protein CcsA [candidate division Zixibacteria bacterium]